MPSLTDLSIRNKLILIFSFLLLFTAGLGGFTIIRIQAMKADTDAIVANMDALLPLGNLGRDSQHLAALIELWNLKATVSGATVGTASNRTARSILDQEAQTEKDFADNWALYNPTMDSGRETDDGNAVNAAKAAKRLLPRFRHKRTGSYALKSVIQQTSAGF